MLYLLQFTIVTAAITDSLKEKEWFSHAQELQVILEGIAIIVAILIATIPYLRKWAARKIRKLARVFIYIWKIVSHPLSPIKACRNQHEIYHQKDNPLEVSLEASTMQMQHVRGWLLHVNNRSPITAYIRTIHILTSAKKEIPWDIDGYYYRRNGAALPAIQNDKNNRQIAILPDIPLLLAIFTETSKNSESCEWFMARVIFEGGEELTSEKANLIRFPTT